jgi:hypothetical protein
MRVRVHASLRVEDLGEGARVRVVVLLGQTDGGHPVEQNLIF